MLYPRTEQTCITGDPEGLRSTISASQIVGGNYRLFNSIDFISHFSVVFSLFLQV